MKQLLQAALIGIVRPYTSRELLGWGKLVVLYNHEWIWKNSKPRSIIDKRHGIVMDLDLSRWSDRNNFFLRRWYDLEMTLLAEGVLLPGDTAVDVGANRGEFSSIAAKVVGPMGKVISFEPNFQCVKRLKRDAARNGLTNVIVHSCALGDVESELELSVPSGETYYGTLTSQFDEENPEKIKCLVRTGDSMLADENPSLIKIDVEGFEVKTLVGMRKTLERSRPVVITEVVPRNLKYCGSTVCDLSNFMTDLGYKGYHLKSKRVGKDFSWIGTPFDASEANYDAVWIPSERLLQFSSQCA